ncbi:MAG: response regulator transcription factor [Butyricicoccus sp.]|nr:response regulator transcription factor [Butyricicoccus sp.]
MQKIMIIEDDPVIRDELALLLSNEGYRTTFVAEFTNAAAKVLECSPNLILLDLNLPKRDGLSLCGDIRKVSQTPVIFVTSRDSAADELHALSLGGDDYITKPYNIPVLLARIKAVLRRSGGAGEPDTLAAGALTLHLTQATVSAGGKSVELTRNELKILSHLMTHAGKIVPRADLIEVLWESQIYIDDNTLSVNVTRLRGKLEELGLPDLIKTRRGLGYQL